MGESACLGRAPKIHPKEVPVLNVIDKVEEKYFSSDANVAPGGWCCWCWCCNSVNYSIF